MYHAPHTNVESYDTSSGKNVELYNRNLVREFYALGMKQSLRQIADRQRKAIQAVFNRLDLEIKSTCEKAGFSEGALRHFLNTNAKKPTRAMGSDKVEALASAIGIPITELLGINAASDTATIDADLMMQCIGEVKAESRAMKEKYTIEQTVFVAIESYNYVITQRQKGKPITEAAAAVSAILKKI